MVQGLATRKSEASPSRKRTHAVATASDLGSTIPKVPFVSVGPPVAVVPAAAAATAPLSVGPPLANVTAGPPLANTVSAPTMGPPIALVAAAGPPLAAFATVPTLTGPPLLSGSGGPPVSLATAGPPSAALAALGNQSVTSFTPFLTQRGTLTVAVPPAQPTPPAAAAIAPPTGINMFAELQAKLAGPSAKAMLRATAGEPLRKRAATTAAVAAPGSPGNQSVMSALKKTLLGRRQKVAASPSPRPTKLVPRSTRRKPNAENVAPDVATKIPQIKGLAVHLAHMDAKREQPNTGLHNDDEWA